MKLVKISEQDYIDIDKLFLVSKGQFVEALGDYRAIAVSVYGAQVKLAIGYKRAVSTLAQEDEDLG